MRNVLWTAILTSTAVVLIGSYSVITYMARHPAMPSMSTQSTVESSAVEALKAGNPLLTADKEAVRRWFPGQCFAEIYNKSPSFGGKLIPNCMRQVIQKIKRETGFTLTESDFRRQEVFVHFKRIFGDDGLWLY